MWLASDAAHSTAGMLVSASGTMSIIYRDGQQVGSKWSCARGVRDGALLACQLRIGVTGELLHLAKRSHVRAAQRHSVADALVQCHLSTAGKHQQVSETHKKKCTRERNACRLQYISRNGDAVKAIQRTRPAWRQKQLLVHSKEPQHRWAPGCGQPCCKNSRSSLGQGACLST